MQTIETLRSLGRIVGGKVLSSTGWSEEAVHLADGLIGGAPTTGQRLDARGCVVLPGIVDFHGDAFERQIMPRPKVSFPLDVAMLETDRQLAANGITTALHGVTHSWEGGLRGEATARVLFAALDRLAPRFLVEHKVHLRYEGHHLAGEAEALGWLSSGRVSLLAFNDHLPGMRRKPQKWQEWADRAETDLVGFEQRLEAAEARGAEVPGLVGRLAAHARLHGVPMASHDDQSISVRGSFQSLACRISEFPLTLSVAEHARAQGSPVVCGAPNVLRGGSHVGAPRAADLARDGLCSILASDYYYPAPLHAACLLAADELLPLEAAWALVSKNPAAALGFEDRGEIAVGKRADLIVLDVQDLRAPRLVATLSGGRIVYLAEGERLHG
ncbi:alpha-D-ribose 1-methylphosphonate 5-triphosphate diphosphatase [Uliginosibacterium flavum]|uniref:Alpha-D-ribose 1-methylphosphonate 5-triphosphate diphosphatase n=1 Tax=Uliginosibacterium flavum TaxID=1396831 RepID=A0ABV2TLR9_9RHOO